MKHSSIMLLMALTFCSCNQFKGDIGSFTDKRDGTVYDWVRIGEQIWMADNLSYLPSVSPAEAGADNQSHYYVYGYKGDNIVEAKNTDNFKEYGVLYNWEATKTACPKGWHVPTDDDWTDLEGYLGMNPSEFEESGFRTSENIGYKLKSTSGWDNNVNGDNSSGFNGIGGGCRFTDGNFYHLNVCGDYWSSTIKDSTMVWGRGIGTRSEGVLREAVTLGWGIAIRCVKDK